MNISGNLATEERLAWIRQQLDMEGSLRIGPAAAHLDVSDMTIRRDLKELEAMGLARRIRGGAVAVGPLPFAERHQHRAKAKGRIAAKLLPLVPESGAIAFDASSTVMRLASTLEARRDLTIVTNGPQTFQALQGKPGIAAILTGGELDSRTGSLVGPVACRAAGHIILNRLFISAAALDPDLGPSETCLEEADVKRTLEAVAGDVVLAVDATKLNTRSMAVSLEWGKISTLVTDLDPKDPQLDPYRDKTQIL